MTKPNQPVLTLEISGMSDEEKLTALALQGLANRRGPRVFYIARFWNWVEADAKWQAYLESSRGMVFEPVESLPKLVEALRDTVKGLVVWDPRREKTKWVAATLAGLRDLLPVAPECIERYPGLPVAEDLRGRFSDNLEPMRWAVENLQPQCNPHMGYSADKLWSGWSLDAVDYAVHQRGFAWSLKPGGKDAPAGEVELLRRVLSNLTTPARIMGWAEPEEDHCATASHQGHFIYCAEAPNLSFFANLPGRAERLAQPARAAYTPLPLEDKHYLTLNVSEGDTPKIHYAMHGGAWHDPRRGEVPFNWGAQPMLLEDFPVLLEYFYESATPNDYFMGGASGAGFVYPNQLPNPEGYFTQVRDSFARADMHETEAWLYFSRPTYDAYAAQAKLNGICMPCGPFGVTLVNQGRTPVFLRGNSGLNYLDHKVGAAGLAQTIRNHCAKRATPSFSTIHVIPGLKGCYSPSVLLEAWEALGRERFSFVTMQQLSDLGREAVTSGRTPDCFSAGYSEW